MMDPLDPAYHMDWMFGSGSNVHVANRRGWFNSYTPFESACDSGFGNTMKVIGIGNLTLRVKKSDNRKGVTNFSTLILEDVLHIPTSCCNILGAPITHHYEAKFCCGRDGLYSMATGGRICIFDQPLGKLWRLRLRGQSATETVLDKESMYWIHATWPKGERARWHRLKARTSQDQIEPTQAPTIQVPAFTVQVPATSVSIVEADVSKMNLANDDPSIPLYTQEEKHWLKKHFDGELEFLRDYGLSIYKDEDREEGRQLLRALMEGDLDNETSTRSEKARVDGDDEPEEENKFLRELEEHPESHFADHHFSEDELEWIEKHYDYSSNFLMTHGLKFYDDEDCQEGKMIVQQFMAEDEKHMAQEEDAEDQDDEGEAEPEEENKFLRVLEEHPESHAADYHFSGDELEWIEKHYDYSSNFLMSFGLKFYDDEDCQEGKLIVQQFMREDD